MVNVFSVFGSLPRSISGQEFKDSVRDGWESREILNTLRDNGVNMRKGQSDVNLFMGIVLIMVGVLAVTFMGMGIIFSNSTLVWVGTVVLGTISVVVAILEKVLIK